jgi:hypothetical protein
MTPISLQARPGVLQTTASNTSLLPVGMQTLVASTECVGTGALRPTRVVLASAKL